MKIVKIPAVGLLVLASVATAPAKPKSKTITPEKVADSQIKEDPYRFNGAVTSGDARGSGFCAWNRRTFFSAAHVVFNDEDFTWNSPPKWHPQIHANKLDRKAAIQSRGYFRWTNYAEIAEEEEAINGKAFGRDFIVGFAFANLTSGSAAKINTSGAADLKKPVRSMMTGYPARIAYSDQPIGGFFMYRTGPSMNTYKTYSGSALETTLISSGPGNSGGPIWTDGGSAGWSAAGVVVGGLPSETIVYAFSSELNTMLDAVSPVVKSSVPQSLNSNSVSSTSRFFSSNRRQQLPDGVHRWTDYPLNVSGFEKDAKVESVKVSVKVKTTHQGDLQVLLTGPGGVQALVHNEEGGGKRNLIINSKDLSEDFEDVDLEGRWTVRFQDRLKGDICTVESVVLELTSVPGQASSGETEP